MTSLELKLQTVVNFLWVLRTEPGSSAVIASAVNSPASVILFVCLIRGFLCNPGCLGTCCVDQNGLEVRDLLAPAS